MTKILPRHVPFLLYLITTTNAAANTQNQVSQIRDHGEVVAGPMLGDAEHPTIDSRIFTAGMGKGIPEKRPFNRPVSFEVVTDGVDSENAKDELETLLAQSAILEDESWALGTPWVLMYPTDDEVRVQEGSSIPTSSGKTLKKGIPRSIAEGNVRETGIIRLTDTLKTDGLNGIKAKLEYARQEPQQGKQGLKQGQASPVGTGADRRATAKREQLTTAREQLTTVDRQGGSEGIATTQDGTLQGNQLPSGARLVVGGSGGDSSFGTSPFGRKTAPYSSTSGGSLPPGLKRSAWMSQGCLMNQSDALRHLVYSLGRATIVRSKVLESGNGFEGSPLLEMTYVYENREGFEKILWPYVKGSSRLAQEIGLELELESGLRQCLGLPWNSIFIMITAGEGESSTLTIRISLTIQSDRSFEKLRRDISTVLEYDQ